MPQPASCCFRSALRVEFPLFSPPLEVRSAHCAGLGGKVVKRGTAVRSEIRPSVRSTEALLAKRVRVAQAPGSRLSSHHRPGLSGPSLLFPPVTCAKRHPDGQALGFLSGAASHDVSGPSLIRPEPASHLASEQSSGRGAHSLLPNSSQTSSKIP